MFIPRYWSRTQQDVRSPKGEILPLESVAGSAISVADALDKARAKLARLVQRVRNGEPLPKERYYVSGELREEIKQEYYDDSGRTLAVMTRNAHGVLVLNAAETMFVDIDFPERSKPGGGGLIGWLFGRKPAPAPDPLPSAMEKIDLFLENHPDWSFRVYRTHSGLRLLAIHDVFDPVDERTLGWMRELGCDPLYLKLCQGQASFRARLTPKPYRCGRFRKPPGAFPWRDAKAETRHREWERHYEQRCAQYKTCEFLGVRGAAEMIPEVEPIITIHDACTCRSEALPLA